MYISVCYMIRVMNMQENPFYENFWYKGLPFVTELTTLFKDVVANESTHGHHHAGSCHVNLIIMIMVWWL